METLINGREKQRKQEKSDKGRDRRERIKKNEDENKKKNWKSTNWREIRQEMETPKKRRETAKRTREE